MAKARVASDASRRPHRVAGVADASCAMVAAQRVLQPLVVTVRGMLFGEPRTTARLACLALLVVAIVGLRLWR